jgi:hypothetical protein
MWEIRTNLPHVEVGQRPIMSIIFAHPLLEFGGKGKNRWVEMWEIIHDLPISTSRSGGGPGLFLEDDLWTRRLSTWWGLS